MQRDRMWVVWALLSVGILAVMGAGVVFAAWRVYGVSRARPIVYSPGAHPTSPWRGSSSPHFDETEGSSKLPSIKRSVPMFDARLLDGCSKSDLDTVEERINDAIGVGAPLYNDGDFEGCYQAYDAGAQLIERVTKKTCKGPAGVLKTGRERAAKLGTPAERAWAMRDAFDGLLDVIDRRGLEL